MHYKGQEENKHTHLYLSKGQSYDKDNKTKR